MAKSKMQCRRVSYGIYTPWNRDAKTLPKILEFTRLIPARIDIEFGYILNIKKAKGKQLSFCIDHPPFRDKHGDIAPPFTGDEYVRSNDWHFFLGDAIWAPVHDKIGPWRLTVELDGQTIADETFTVIE
ncbi:MAG: DUF3859 domain-containing protein, partial [Phycisphaeraceae bacterium]|nr:DUF3859 domain-containing protein [Phycisphaeraceae bacterium]